MRLLQQKLGAGKNLFTYARFASKYHPNEDDGDDDDDDNDNNDDDDDDKIDDDDNGDKIDDDEDDAMTIKTTTIKTVVPSV